jgi:hypothetical protein
MIMSGEISTPQFVVLDGRVVGADALEPPTFAL